MLKYIIQISLRHKFIVILLVGIWILAGLYSLSQLSIGAVPDITNNQVQVITTSRNLATEDVEKFLTYPVELEMANLPGVEEIRSISKFGLSVVTIVFNEKMGTYLPRQLIEEKLKSAEGRIPEGFGTPFLGPVSTGLGEIYQYILDIKPGYEDRYTVTDLRTIQDWVVKRHLSGIPGVVEINTWGGLLKTYEVAVDPQKIKALSISLSSVYEALEANNSLAGGGYIEKSHESYFIRGEGLVTSLEDLGKIVVDYREGIPIFIKDIAELGQGHATRFGAITGNGEGEKVLGQVMMLKGASSKEVINAVKDKVSEVQQILPEGVYINPFLERSGLIERTTFTITENLILGSLIVIFVVILLLGNVRSGLIVASVIPLSLLFAITMMYLFQIDANLMSLGAIDFGIIIDGAVIIVEYTAYKISKSQVALLKSDPVAYQAKKDKLTFESTHKMMNSAVFGQIIIILVFIPILSLTGVEGKMFRPMALTFSFALLGAMILCFTYVPVASALFLRPKRNGKITISDRLVRFMLSLYTPSLKWALKNKHIMLSLALMLLVSSGIIFSKLGGEFIPTLDEGDFVIQPVLKTGMSLSETVKMTTRIERIIKQFPEVDQVVTRIGAAEVPTDPMSMEETDIIITLNPRRTWTSASSKDELANVFKSRLEEEIPGIEIEFTQPIEMRFNELLTGVRADLAIKIFGEDLDILYHKALEIRDAIHNVPGASDIVVEKTEGLPQMIVAFDRQKIAQFGLNVNDLNDIISIGFAGKSAGVIFEGERQFDIVLRYPESFRNSLEDLRNAQVSLPDGSQLPLSSFADIRYDYGPAKISRDDTKRRIVVGVNVRGKDLQSVVDEVRQIIAAEVDIPSGYLVEYGGQFENLQSASKRLLIAVPLALLLIFIMLYFAFQSLKDAILIFTAIPLASVGGIFLLALRGMPFSISAGVGFIALFGIAVLNGIVLLDHYKELKEKGELDLYEIIIQGTAERMRPVLLTASAAALGFLPMAVSTSAGAEVQRPLATVVIGGLVSATLLTLIILPILYYMVAQFNLPKNRNGMKTVLFLILFSIFPASDHIMGQESITLEQAINLAFKQNLMLKVQEMQSLKTNALIQSARDIPKSEFYYHHDRANIGENGLPLHAFGFSQSIQSPQVYASRKALFQENSQIQVLRIELQKWILAKEISLSFNDLAFQEALYAEWMTLDSLYARFETAANRKFELGESNQLEKLTALAKRQSIQLQLKQTTEHKTQTLASIRKWIQSNETVNPVSADWSILELQPQDVENHPQIRLSRQEIVVSEQEYKIAGQYRLPEYNVSFFNGISGAENFDWYPGIQTGIVVPLWRKAYLATESAAKLEVEGRTTQLEFFLRQLENQKLELMAELEKYRQAINQYKNTDQILEQDLINTAERLFQGGEIDYFQYVQAIEHATAIKIGYLNNLHDYNQTVILINYLII